jgi:nitrite reductase/ring-hydroxylating ferredoxin subunit
MADNFTRVASVNEVPPGQMIAIIADGAELFLANVGGQFFALSNICSHEWAYLSEGWLKEESFEVECPLHEGRFDLRSGRPTKLPPDEPVPAYTVKVEGEDILVGPSA